jgi:DNA repair protein RadA/Sms
VKKSASAPGSVSQVREITFELMRFGKERNIAIFIIGHITKEGSLQDLESWNIWSIRYFILRAILQENLRLLRGFKNRFGATSEVGIFEMTKNGLVSAKDISKKFFTRGVAQAGSAITVLMEGSRPIVLGSTSLSK